MRAFLVLSLTHSFLSLNRSDEEKYLWVEAISAVLGVANSRDLGGIETAPITDFDSHEIAQRLGSPNWDSGNFIEDDDGSDWGDANLESGGSGRKRRFSAWRVVQRGKRSVCLPTHVDLNLTRSRLGDDQRADAG